MTPVRRRLEPAPLADHQVKVALGCMLVVCLTLSLLTLLNVDLRLDSGADGAVPGAWELLLLWTVAGAGVAGMVLALCHYLVRRDLSVVLALVTVYAAGLLAAVPPGPANLRANLSKPEVRICSCHPGGNSRSTTAQF
jgi:hypothetical protein